MKSLKTALKREPFQLVGRVPPKERAARIDLRQGEERIRDQIEREIADACRATDAALVWDAMGALRVAEQQVAVLAAVARVNGMKSERLARKAKESKPRPRRGKGELPLALVPKS